MSELRIEKFRILEEISNHRRYILSRTEDQLQTTHIANRKWTIGVNKVIDVDINIAVIVRLLRDEPSQLKLSLYDLAIHEIPRLGASAQ